LALAEQTAAPKETLAHKEAIHSLQILSLWVADEERGPPSQAVPVVLVVGQMEIVKQVERPQTVKALLEEFLVTIRAHFIQVVVVAVLVLPEALVPEEVPQEMVELVSHQTLQEI
jgi:acid stress-induced BolA-like protein IbaG/YrbA